MVSELVVEHLHHQTDTFYGDGSEGILYRRRGRGKVQERHLDEAVKMGLKIWYRAKSYCSKIKKSFILFIISFIFTSVATY